MLCFGKFPVANSFMDKKGGSTKIFRRKFCFLTVPKNFARETFRVSLVSGTEKFYASEFYVSTFCRNFLLTVPKNFVEEPFSLSLISAIEKFYA